MCIYSIYDSVAEEFSSNLFVAKNDGVATRLYNNSVKALSDDLKKDLKLFCLGKFYTNTGKIYAELREVVLTNEGVNIDDVLEKDTEKIDSVIPENKGDDN